MRPLAFLLALPLVAQAPEPLPLPAPLPSKTTLQEALKARRTERKLGGPALALEEAAATLGASPLDRFFTVALPLARPGFVTAAILSFAHTVGEFGVVLMLGGNIPGITRVVSVQIYDHVEALEYAQAHWLAGGMVLFSFVVLLCLNLTRRSPSAIS